MKYISKAITIAILAIGLSLTSCSKWTEIEPKEIDHNGGANTLSPEERDVHYASLRAWKKTAENYGRPVSFGWFSNWSPEGSVRKGYLSALPDSIDMVSMWSGPFGISEAKKADKAYVQKVKGTKVFVCFILHNIGTGITPSSIADKVVAENPNDDEGTVKAKIKKAQEAYWGYTSGVKGSPDHTAAIKKYAKALCDTIVKYDYDGLDIDWEPNVAGDGDGSLKGYRGQYLHILVQELGKYLGPKATIDTGKRRYLLVDGELWQVKKESGPYFDYFISQAYGDSDLDYRESRVSRNFGEYYHTRKHIYTDNFESSSQSGGVLLKQAKYNSADGPKGGVGAYRIDNDYDNQPDYKWTRKAIYLMHKSYAEYIKKHPQP